MGHKMIHRYCLGPSRIHESQDCTTELIRSRNLFSVQTIEYDLMTVTSLDIETNNFILVGLSNGSVDLQEVDDPTFGTS
jgi:hypothetical protein